MASIEDTLRKLRGHLAHKKQVAPYQIFNDKTLELLLKEKPTTVEALSKLKGFPKEGYRVTNLGEIIVEVFRTKKDYEFEIKDKNGELFIVALEPSRSFQ
jgi:superfamily II DNA helicase RecQ